MPVTKTQSQESKEIVYVGKGWLNTVNNRDSKAFGKQYINITLDRGIDEVTVGGNEKLQLWFNNKREGKNDAEYRVSLVTA